MIPVLAHEVDRGRDREVCRRIASALPVVPLRELRLAVAPADDERVEGVLVLGQDMEEARALRRAQPFVAVAGVEVRSQALEVERHLTRAVGAVDHAQRPGFTRLRAQLLDRKEDGGRRADMADHEHARPLARARPDRVRVDAGRPDDSRTGALGHELEQELDRPVFVTGREDLVTGREGERPQHRVQRRGRVRDEREISRARPTYSPSATRTRASSSRSLRASRSTGSRSSSRCHSW